MLNLSATRGEDEVEIKATVKGLKTTDDDPRLILVLLEDGIELSAPNGIRIHNCIARGFAGGYTGIKLKKGDSEHTQKISLSKLKSDALAHLKEYEDQAGRQFPMKPLKYAKLKVAAIVQYFDTKGYLQSAVADVVASDSSEEAKPAEAKPTEEKPTETKPADDKPAEKPAEDKPAEKPEANPTEEKPAEPKSEEKPAEEKSGDTPETKPEEQKPEEDKPASPPTENKPQS
jgi:hypothetical protein